MEGREPVFHHNQLAVFYGPGDCPLPQEFFATLADGLTGQNERCAVEMKKLENLNLE